MSVRYLVAVLCFTSPLAFGQSQDAERERQIIERFTQVLLRSPQRGTAFDRVYGYHTENDSLSTFVAGLQENKADGKVQLVLGLVNARQANDAAAVEFFGTAARLLTDNPLPPWYRAESLIAIGQLDAAIKDFELALERARQPTRRIAIYRQLGRTHQRTYNHAAARAVWQKLEAEYPGREDVQEEIAKALAADGLNQQAADRFEQLAAKTRDAYRKVRWTIRHAELLAELDRRPEAIKRLSRLSADLRPGSWLHRDVRDRVEQLFLSKDDYPGLTQHLQQITAAHPDDLDAQIRLSEVYRKQGRLEDAITTLSAAVQVAPGDLNIRQSLVQTLISAERLTEAEQQYAELHQRDPGNPDVLVNWGQLVASRTDGDKAEHRQAAIAIWRKLLGQPQDAGRLALVAGLLQRIDADEEAMRLYRQAIAAAPENSQYRIRLGELLDRSGDRAAALAEWRLIAAAERRSVDSLRELSRVLSRYEALPEAVTTLQAAIERDVDLLDLRLELAALLCVSERYDEALQQIAIARAVAESPEEQERVLAADIDILQQARRLEVAASGLHKKLLTAPQTTADEWLRLTKYAQAARQFHVAISASREAVQRAPESISVRTVSADILELNGQLQAAADERQTLVGLDIRHKSQHLKRLAGLRERLGQRALALQAGRELLQSGGPRVENTIFFADICVRMNEFDTGLEALQRAIRANPRSSGLLQRLAELLDQQFRTEEAIETYWRLFDKTDSLPARLSVVSRLASLHARVGTSEQMVGRLKRLRTADRDARRDFALCLAKAHEEFGQPGQAINVLEETLIDHPEDTALLKTLADLAQWHLPPRDAIRYQQRLWELRPSPAATQRLVQILAENRDYQTALDLLQRSLKTATTLAAALQSYDLAGEVWTEQPRAERQSDKSMLKLMLENVEREFGPHWSILNRRAALLVQQHDTTAELKELADQLLAMDVQRDELDPTLVGRSNGARDKYQSLAQQRVTSSGWTFYGWRENEHFDYGRARVNALHWLATRDTRADFESVERILAHNPVLSALRQQVEAGSDETTKDDLLELALAFDEDRTKPFTELVLKLGRLGHPGTLEYLLSSRELLDSDAGRQLAVAFLLDQPPTADSRIWHDLASVSERSDAAVKQLLREHFLPFATRPVHHTAMLSTAASMDEINHDLSQLTASLRVSPQSRLDVYQEIYYPLCYRIARQRDVLRSAAAANDLSAVAEMYQYFQTVRRHLEPPRPDLPSLLLQRGRWSAYREVCVLGEDDDLNSEELNYPPERSFASDVHVNLFHALYRAYRSVDRLPRLVGFLKQQFEGDGQEADRVLAAMMNLVWLYAWEDDAESAYAVLQAARARFPDNAELMTDIALVRAQLKDYDGAADLVAAFTPQNRSQLELKETLAMGLAVQRQDVERARTSAKRLFGLRLSQRASAALRDNLELLGMTDLVEQMDVRRRYQSRRNVDELEDLMRATNDPQQASEIALLILQQTQPGADDWTRSAALRKLKGAGRLTTLVEAAENAFEQTPGSLALYRKLQEFYDFQDRDDALIDLALRWEMARNPGGTSALMVKLQPCLEAENFEAACDLIFRIVRQDPAEAQSEFFGSTQWDYVVRFTGREREFADVLRQIPATATSARACLDYSSLLFRREADAAIGCELLDRFWIDDVRLPILRFQHSNLFFEEPGLRYAERWLLTEYLDRPVNGVLLEAARRTLEGMQAADRLSVAEESLREHLSHSPDSPGAMLVMALICILQDRDEDAAPWFARLFEEVDISSDVLARWRKEMPPSDAYRRELSVWLSRSLDRHFTSESPAAELLFLLAEYERVATRPAVEDQLKRLTARATGRAATGVAGEAQDEERPEAELLRPLLKYQLAAQALEIMRLYSASASPREKERMLRTLPPAELLQLVTRDDGQLEYFLDESRMAGGLFVSSLLIDVLRTVPWPNDSRHTLADEFDQAIIGAIRSEGQDSYPQAVARLQKTVEGLLAAEPAADSGKSFREKRLLAVVALANRPTISPEIDVWQPTPIGRRYTPSEWSTVETLGRLASRVLERQPNLGGLFAWQQRMVEKARWAPDPAVADRWLEDAMRLCGRTAGPRYAMHRANESVSGLTEQQRKRQLSVALAALKAGRGTWAVDQLERMLVTTPNEGLSVDDLLAGRTGVINGSGDSDGISLAGDEPWAGSRYLLERILLQLRKMDRPAATQVAMQLVLPEGKGVFLYPIGNQEKVDTIAGILIRYAIADGTLHTVETRLSQQETAGVHPRRCELMRLMIAVETNDIATAKRMLQSIRADAAQASLTFHADHALFALPLVWHRDQLVEEACDAVIALLKTDIGRRRFTESLPQMLQSLPQTIDERQPGRAARLLDKFETELGWSEDPLTAPADYYRTALAIDLWSRSTDELADRLRKLLPYDLKLDADSLFLVRDDLPDDIVVELLLRTRFCNFPLPLPDVVLDLNKALKPPPPADVFQRLPGERELKVAVRTQREEDLIAAYGAQYDAQVGRRMEARVLAQQGQLELVRQLMHDETQRIQRSTEVFQRGDWDFSRRVDTSWLSLLQFPALRKSVGHYARAAWDLQRFDAYRPHYLHSHITFLNSLRAGWSGQTTESPTLLQHWDVSAKDGSFDGNRLRLLVNDQRTYDFEIPLSGNFEAELTVTADPRSFAALTYGPVSLSSEVSEGKEVLKLSGLDGRESITQTRAREKTTTWHWRLVVKDRRVEYFCDGDLLFSDSLPDDSFPWLRITASGTPLLESFQLSGSPRIPTTVSLIDGPQLTGWEPVAGLDSNLFFDSADIARPAHPRFGTEVTAPFQLIEQTPLWALSDHQELTGGTSRRLDLAGVAYQRGMQVGDEIRYQFYYAPGRWNVSPILGQMRLLVNSDGVRRQAVTRRSIEQVSTVKTMDATPISRSLEAILKSDDWNDVRLAWTATGVKFWLNGILVCTYESTQTTGSTFGLTYDCDPGRMAVRHMTLTGDWATAKPDSVTATDFQWSSQIDPQSRDRIIAADDWLSEFLQTPHAAGHVP